MEKNHSPSLWNLLGTAFIAIVVLIYALMTFSTEDPLWFSPTFAEVPNRIEINCYGEKILLYQEDPQFSGLNSLIQEVLSGEKNYDPLTMSDDTYTEYQETEIMMIMELHYSTPVRIHSIYKFFSNLDSIVIPLDGRHSQTRAIFGRKNDNNTAGSLHYLEIPTIKDYLVDNQICVQP